MADSMTAAFQEHARALTDGERERMADELEALAVRLRIEPPVLGAVTREYDGVDRWMILAVWGS